jgi:hypothetical protein
MLPGFSFDPPSQQADAVKRNATLPEEKQEFEELFIRLLKPEEKDRLIHLLLHRLKQGKPQLEQMLGKRSGHRKYEDPFYRYYHGSFKVYAVQDTTERAVRLLRDLLPERKLNVVFERIVGEGTGKQFELEHNKEWDRHTRPMLEAFAHAKFMVEMAVRYADLPEPPALMPSGWAALLYLYDLR